MSQPAPLPADILHRQWLNVVRRCQAAARQQDAGGVALITISVLVNAESYPLWWTSPKVLKLEPKSGRIGDQIAGLDPAAAERLADALAR
jgi:hypothetical protein